MRGIGWNRLPGCLGPREQVCADLKRLQIVQRACGHPVIGRGPQRVRDRTTASRAEVRTKAGWSDVGGDVLSSRNPAEVSRFDEDRKARAATWWVTLRQPTRRPLLRADAPVAQVKSAHHRCDKVTRRADHFF